MSTKEKPYKGQIAHCIKRALPPEQKQEAEEMYGPNLGYYYLCQFVGHPRFGTTGKLDGAHTSLVVKEFKKGKKTYVETLNSMYEKI
jgi:hypothetical protein